MKKNLIILMVTFLMGNVVSVYGIVPDEIAQMNIKNMDIKEIITLLTSSDWQIQDKMIGKIEYDNPTLLNDERIQLLIIKVLEDINANNEKLATKLEEYRQIMGQEPPPDWKPEGIIWSDGYGEFQLYVLEIVEGFKNKRAIFALVGSIECGGYRQIAEFGELAVPYLLERLEKTKNESAVSSIIKALGEIVKRSKITLQPIEGTPTTKVPLKAPVLSQTELLKEAFIKNLKDPNPFVRMAAIEALGSFGDHSTIPLLKPIAENDPEVWNTVSKDPSKFQYPVREEAQRVIKLLEEKKKEQEVQTHVK